MSLTREERQAARADATYFKSNMWGRPSGERCLALVVAKMRGAQFVPLRVNGTLVPAEAMDNAIAMGALVDVAQDLGYEDEHDFLNALDDLGSAIVERFPTD